MMPAPPRQAPIAPGTPPGPPGPPGPSLPIPLTVSDLTPQWMTQVLRRHTSEATVVSVEVVDSHSGTTGRALLRLTYAGDPGPLPRRVFCKLAPFDPRQRRLLQEFGIGSIEARFYSELAGDLVGRVGVRIPRVWHAQTDDEGSFVMVLEDLAASGCRFRRWAAGDGKDDVGFDAIVDAGPPDAVDRARATVDELARLHAGFWGSRRFADELSWVPERAGFGDGKGRDTASLEASAHFARKAVDQFSHAMTPGFREVGGYYASHVGQILDLWDDGERTLVHGDPHEGNLFDDGVRAGFFDWAMFSRSPGTRDLAYFCCTSLPVEVRRSSEAELARRYRGHLAAAGINLPGELADLQYRVFAVFAWVSMASTAAMGSRWQPVATGVRAMRRATAAVEDLSSVDALAHCMS